MKLLNIPLVGAISAGIAMAACFSNSPTDPIVKDQIIEAVYEGTTPCGRFIREFHKVPSNGDCALISWKLTLYKNPTTNEPSTYTLLSTNRFIVRETNMYSSPGVKHTISGKWTIANGANVLPKSKVYQLSSENLTASIRLVKINEDLLHLLDLKGDLMIGNPFHSYTLNRSLP